MSFTSTSFAQPSLFAAVTVEHPSKSGKAASVNDNKKSTTSAISAVECQTEVANEQSATKAHHRERIVFASMCLSLFLAGWNDGNHGPLIPRMQEFYSLNFLIVALVFIFNCLASGFLSGAVTNMYLSEHFSFGVLVAFGAAIQVMAYLFMAFAPPFPVLVLGYAFNGFGISIQDAQANSLVASLNHRPEDKMGILHAVYGLGAIGASLVATQFAQLSGRYWAFHHLVSLGIAIVNLAAMVIIVRWRTMEDVLIDIGSPPQQVQAIPMQTVESDSSPVLGEELNQAPTAASSHEKSVFKQIMSHKVAHLLALFTLIYVGTEVTIGGWIVSFIIHERGGGPQAGYISSGFFGGITLGRVALLWVNRLVGERLVVYIYTVAAIGLEMVVWFVPSLIGNAVAVSIVGLLLGPLYPICMTQTGRILPRKLRAGGIGWVAGCGQAGSALLPFITGALANRFGISSLQPLTVSMLGFLMVLWAFVPPVLKRQD